MAMEKQSDKNGGHSSSSDELEKALEKITRLREENENLRKLLGLSQPDLPENETSKQAKLFPEEKPLPIIESKSSVKEKISLFRTIFRGREDVFAVHWINEKTGKKGYSPARENPYQKNNKKNYLSLTDEIVHDHLSGNKIIGIYPLLKDDTCWFLASDFDKEGWELDALEYLATCKRWKIPAYLERSRSGNGGHVWIFFSAPVPAVSARRIGVSLLRETMVARAEMDLGSYDRLFPNQDFMPKGGFGNLIAVPLQKKARALKNTEFIDENLNPWPDQWAFLCHVKRLSPQQVEGLIDILPPVTVGPQSIESLLKPSKNEPLPPPEIKCSFGAQVSIEKSGLPPSLISRIKHLASLHNPEFYKRQKLRLSTYLTPRFIKCYREDLTHFHLPRGIIPELNKIVTEAGSKLDITDKRRKHESLELTFQGKLTAIQEEVIENILPHEQGVLVAPPGVGKTIMACYVIVSRNVPTLVLAHRKPLLDQWRVQLMNTLGLTKKQIGQFGGGRSKRNGIVDLAMIQSLKNKQEIEDIFDEYGLLIVDECHHIPAFSFENVVNKSSIRSILGLTATPYRRDGLQDIITMQCGPIRCHIKQDAGNAADLDLKLFVRETAFTCLDLDENSIQDIFRELVQNEDRNSVIAEEALSALSDGRRVLILSEWRKHCRLLAEKIRDMGKEPIVLDGSLKKKTRDEMFQSIRNMPREKDLLVIATGPYIGEGFDCPQIDTLLLAFPIAFRGKVVQYAGRLLRQFDGKTQVLVYDYADEKVPVLKKMHGKRLKAYRDLGFTDEKVDAEQLHL